MTDFYSSLAETATRLLRTKGQSMTLSHAVVTYNPATSSGADAGADDDAWGAVFEFTDQAHANAFRKGQTLVSASVQKVVLSPQGLTADPAIGDTLTIGLLPYAVLSVKKIAPAGTAVVFILQVGT